VTGLPCWRLFHLIPTIGTKTGSIISCVTSIFSTGHHKPHLHAEYAEYKAVLSLEDGALFAGELPSKKLKIVKAWMAIHEDELQADWKLAVEGKELYRIEPLR